MAKRTSVRAVIVHEGKLLCCKLKANQAGGDDFWCLPGGGTDRGEELKDALRREMIEETGVKPVIGNLLYIQKFNDGAKDIEEYIFLVKNTEDYLNIDLAKTTHGQQELSEIAFIDPKNNYVLPKFLSTEPLADRARAVNPVTIAFTNEND